MKTRTATALLIDLIDRLLAQHRDGIAPTFGQLEDLTDLAASARRELPGTARHRERV